MIEIAQEFMNSAEFKTMYGENPSNASMAQQFYHNVLHRAPDASGLQYWINILDTKQAPPAYVISMFSECTENVAALVGVTDAGFPSHLTPQHRRHR